VKERLKKYAQLGEIVGAVAIVVTLLFVGLELRQSNRLARTESLRAGTQIWSNEYSDSFGTEESTAFMRKAMNDYRSLSEDEKGRFFAAIMGFVSAFDTLHNQYEAGLLRKEVYESIARNYYGLVSKPGAQEILEVNVPSLPAYLMSSAGNDLLVLSEDDFEPFSFLGKQ